MVQLRRVRHALLVLQVKLIPTQIPQPFASHVNTDSMPLLAERPALTVQQVSMTTIWLQVQAARRLLVSIAKLASMRLMLGQCFAAFRVQPANFQAQVQLNAPTVMLGDMPPQAACRHARHVCKAQPLQQANRRVPIVQPASSLAIPQARSSTLRQLCARTASRASTTTIRALGRHVLTAVLDSRPARARRRARAVLLASMRRRLLQPAQTVR
jgi:hypothetical protein